MGGHTEMRPDEHKKKKSAQYQRKHGGGGGAKGGKNENDKTSSKSGKSSSSKDEKSAHATRSTPQEKAVDISSDSEVENLILLCFLSVCISLCVLCRRVHVFLSLDV